MPAEWSRIVTNADRIVTIRVAGAIVASAANAVVDPEGALVVRPGQGGVVLSPTTRDRALGWESDHLEPGVTIGHPEPEADDALQVFSCIGNTATVIDGPAVGHRGVVFGKHGGVLVSFAPEALALLGPGDRVAIASVGVGLAIDGEPDVVVHSCAPDVADRLITRSADGRLAIRVAATVPAEAAGAGVGMAASRYDLDLQVSAFGSVPSAADLRFGDVVAIADQDHRVVRAPRPGWVAVGVVAHGRSVGGGHGLGLATLITGPAERFELLQAPDANLFAAMSG